MRKNKKNEAEGQPKKAAGNTMRLVGALVLVLPATAGAILSWKGLFDGSSATFGEFGAAIFSLLVDALAVGSAARWVASVRDGSPIQGWRTLAHSAIAATVVLNAYAADTWSDVPWHVVAPLVWSAIIELVAKDLAQAHNRENRPVGDRIRWALWLASPIESLRTKLRQARTGQPSAIQARADVTHVAAARVSVRRAIPGVKYGGDRRIIARQLRRGALPPALVPRLVQEHHGDPDGLLPAVQTAVLAYASDKPIGAHRKNQQVATPDVITVDGQPVPAVSVDDPRPELTTKTSPPGPQAGQSKNQPSRPRRTRTEEWVVNIARYRYEDGDITTRWLTNISGCNGKQTVVNARKRLVDEKETHGRLLPPEDEFLTELTEVTELT